MTTRRGTHNMVVIGGLAASVLVLALVAEAAPDRVRVYYREGNSVSVQVIPEGRPAMTFLSEGSDRWVFTGDTRPLVGKSYAIRLQNHGRLRIKAVVGVDGVNVFFRKPIEGTAREDIGAVLGPGEVRVIRGFQADMSAAEQFVFSPPEFSEGQRVEGSRVGELEVHIYEEWRPEPGGIAMGRPDGGRSEGAPGGPDIGTTTGDVIDSSVRRVRFVSATPEPAARMLLVYGRPDEGWRREDYRPNSRLGIVIDRAENGSRITEVEPDSLAEEVGLRRGDVILKVDSEEEPSPQTLRQILKDKGRGDYLFLEVERGRHRLTFKIRL
ncbi:MAG TPA: PDZ domain-containing protein [Thermoanaerobaculaceae bacterium]|nr:PDZ domain-containing protein [Thermoanaerobaculaceae bacterium]HPS77025.1 PDZ domain-containing protein [Thermoanaerobaculaceae bacterium]